uniref:Uncharacterized protein n=1 Tax=Gasterosteus aculeatus aculeatus TaxID=481459 RepID=G3NQE6_GASAC
TTETCDKGRVITSHVPCEPVTMPVCDNGYPPVRVYDEKGCCFHYECRCICSGWGDPHYMTFDGQYYSFQKNCTYVLFKEIILKHGLKIHIVNENCNPAGTVTCVKSLIVFYKNYEITLTQQRNPTANKVHFVIPTYSNDDFIITSTAIELKRWLNMKVPMHVPHVVTHCTCDNNKTNDCRLPNGQIQPCSQMGWWRVVENSTSHCENPSPSPAPELLCKPAICEILMSKVFEECHKVIAPKAFYESCKFDVCHNATDGCSSMEVYAMMCAELSVCVPWRNATNGKCEHKCSGNKVYKPCGPKVVPTCNASPNESTMNYTTEGCFCPDGMKLFNKDSGVCVDKCGCLDPEGIPREFNERFDYKCQTCICEESTKTVSCKPKACPKPPIANCSEPGFVVINQTNPSDSCCSSFVCQCQSSKCPVYNMNCPIGYKPVISVPEGKCCPERACEPKRVCVHKESEYQPGSPVPAPKCQDCVCTNEVDPRSGLFKIHCEFQKCQTDCDMGYEYMETDSLECCGKCVQTHCIAIVNDTKNLLKPGDTWSPPLNQCEHYSCLMIGDTLTTYKSHVVCPAFVKEDCQPGTIETAANGCCKICVSRDKACKLVSMKQKVMHNRCQSNEEVDMPYCEGSCNTFTKYSEAAAAMQHSCSCCKETRSSNRTIALHCLNGDVVPFSYTHVDECGCGHRDCATAAAQLTRRRRSSTLV